MSSSTKTYAEKMVSIIQTALASNPAGVVEVRFADGRIMEYDRAQALEELVFWENRVSDEARGTLRNKVHISRMYPPGAI